MQVRRQLDIGFGLIIVLLMIIAGMSVWSLSRAQYASVHLDNAFGQQRLLARLLTSINQQMRELGEYVLTGDHHDLDELRAYEQETLIAFDDWKLLITHEAQHFDDPSGNRSSREFDAWRRFHTEYTEMAHVCDRVVSLVQNGQRLQAIDLMEQQVEILHDKTIAVSIEKMIRAEDAEIAAVSYATWQMYGRVWHLTTFVTIIALAVAAITSRLVTRSITRPLAKLGQAAACIGNSDFDTRVDIASDSEIGQLADAMNRMACRLKESTTSISELRYEITHRQRAEKQLEDINKELNHFACVVSHDLKAPLRGITLVVDWLCADHADTLSEDAVEQLDLLKSRVQRMHRLIDGILQYSRIGRVKEAIEPIDLNDLLDELLDSICPGEHIEVTIREPLPTIIGECTRIAQVFQNLISNAIKYMDKPQGRITVACDEGPDAWTFSVSDNGPGIEAKHFERIFQIFQTLESQDGIDSTGVGLALVKKIVEQYGGTVWVASEVGQGSTFYFTLPKQQTPCLSESSESSNDARERQYPHSVPSGPASDPGRESC